MLATSTAQIQTQGALQKKVPHQLISTNLEGVYATPPPPLEFDPNTASAASLAKHGLFFRRPTAQDPPKIIALWQRVFGRKWLSQDRIVPMLEPQVGVTHNKRKVIKTDTGFSSANWGGASIQGQWSTVVGSWQVPTVSVPPQPQGLEGGFNSASWIGIDGAYGSNDVLQAGVEQRVTVEGKASYVAWFEWYAQDTKATLGDTSQLTPALASLTVNNNNNLYIAWKGDGNDNLNVMLSTDGGNTFHSKLTLPETSSQAPALAVQNGILFMAWKDAVNDNLNVAVVNIDPVLGFAQGLSNQVVLGVTSPLSPSLVSLGGNLYISWVDVNNQLNVMVSLDNGATFGSQFISTEASPQAPALGTFNGNLYIAWKGDGNDNLNVAEVDTNPSPTGLSNRVTLSDTSPHSPALAELAGRLYITWKGDGNDHLNVMFSTDGQTFGDKIVAVETSPEGPSLTTLNANVFIGWKGHANDHLNVATITELSAPGYVFQTNITNLPVKPGDTITCSVQYVHYACPATGRSVRWH
jgi:hypothetical protein